MRECCTVSAGEGEHPLSSETHTIRRYSDIRVIRITLWLFLRVSLVQQRGVDLDPMMGARSATIRLGQSEIPLTYAMLRLSTGNVYWRSDRIL